jgi:hypothetical protein
MTAGNLTATDPRISGTGTKKGDRKNNSCADHHGRNDLLGIGRNRYQAPEFQPARNLRFTKKQKNRHLQNAENQQKKTTDSETARRTISGSPVCQSQNRQKSTGRA